MIDFLSNKAQVKSGPKYVHIHPESPVYARSGDTFTQTKGKVKKDIHKIMPQDKCQPFTDSSGKRWFDIGDGAWVSEDDVDADIGQYDLDKLGFKAFEEPSTSDMTESLREGWIKDGFTRIAEWVRPERGIREKQVSDYYKALLRKMDSDNSGDLSGAELRLALNYAELDVRDIAARMVVRHDSEWFGGSSHHRWRTFLKQMDPLCVSYVRQWFDDMEWMSKVDGFSSGAPVWHMHPVVFLDSVRDKFTIHITPNMLYKVFNGLKSPAKFSFLQEIADEINNHASEYKLDTISRVNHFFAQIREEMGGAASPFEGLNYSEEGLKANFSYFRSHPAEAKEYSYTKVNGKITKHANEIAIADRVYANRLGNGNVASGDGSTYRGRGGIHLTGKVNYQGFSDYYKKNWSNDVDFISNPSMLEEGTYCVRSAVYFWLREKLYDLADQGDTGAVVDKITAKVNLDTTSYAKRREHFEKIKSTNVFADAF
jgi:predicted chitinase